MKRVFIRVIVCLLIAACLLSACGGSGGVFGVPAETPADNVPESTPPATVPSTPEIFSDGYPEHPWYQEGDNLITYAESLGHILFEYGGVIEEGRLTFIYGGESN